MADRILGPQGSKRRRRFLWVPMVAIAALALFVIGNAAAVHDETFQLDGDVTASTTTNIGGHAQSFDWDSFFNASGQSIYTSFPNGAVPGFSASGFDRDFKTGANGAYDTSDSTTYTQGSKDIDNVSSWVCTPANNVTNKGDIQNSYAVAYTDPVTKHQFIYFALERNFNQGDANVAFWFLQDASANCDATNGTTNFTGNHSDGDLFVVSAFTKGGVVSTVNAYRWNGGANGSLGTTPVASGGDCTATQPPAPLGDSTCAAVNKGTIPIPWLTNNNGKTNGTGHSLLVSEFFEGGVDLTQSGLADKCFNTFVADTRSSQTLNATLYDFARGSLGECKSTTETTPTPAAGSNGTIPANAQVTTSDSALITVNGIAKFSGTVKFFLCGPGVAAGANCQTGGVQIGTTQTLTDVTSPQTVASTSATITSVGKYCWRAEYSGDSARGVPPSTDPINATVQSECFSIAPRGAVLTTTAGAGPVDFGNPVTDTAGLSNTANRPGTGGLGNGSINPTGGNGPAGGSITFTLYKADCTTVATGTGNNPQTVTTISGDGTYGPVSFTPDAPGTYHWVASYSGDSPNTTGASHNTACDDPAEDVVVRQIPTHIKTKQDWIPNDTATVSADVGNLVAGGSVQFQLFDNATCSGGSPLYSETVSVPGGNPSAEVGTSNTGSGAGMLKISTAYTDGAGSSKGKYSWKVSYTPAAADTAHLGTQSSCDAENFTINYKNDNGPN